MDLTKMPDYYKANALLFGSFSMKPFESKVFAWLVKQIQPDDQEFEFYSITKQALMKALHYIDDDNFEKELENASLSLLKMQIGMKSGGVDFDYFNVFGRCKYTSSNELFQIKVNEDMRPFLLLLKERGNFSGFFFESIARFNNKHTHRFYEICGSKLHNPTNKERERYSVFELGVEEINTMLQVNYKSYSDLDRKILKPSINDLNTYAVDISVKYTPIKVKPIKIKRQAGERSKIERVQFEVFLKKEPTFGTEIIDYQKWGHSPYFEEMASALGGNADKRVQDYIERISSKFSNEAIFTAWSKVELIIKSGALPKQKGGKMKKLNDEEKFKYLYRAIEREQGFIDNQVAIPGID